MAFRLLRDGSPVDGAFAALTFDGGDTVPTSTGDGDEAVLSSWFFPPAPVIAPVVRSTNIANVTGNVTISKTVSVTAGDLVVSVYTNGNDLTGSIGSPVDGTNTYVLNKQSSVPVGSGATVAYVSVHSAIAAATNAALTITYTAGTARDHTLTVYVFQVGTHGGIGASSNTANGGTAPSLNLTTTRTHSSVITAIADWNAVVTSGYVWRPSPGQNFAEAQVLAQSQETVFVSLSTDIVGGIGTVVTGGLTGTAAQAPAMVMVEVSPAISPEAFGAYGNGESDDTTAIQAAFNALTAGLTMTANNKYVHSAVVTMGQNGGTLTGTGTFIAVNEAASSVLIDANNITISGSLTFKMKYTSTTRWGTYDQMKVRTTPKTGLSITGLTIDGSAAAGIYIGGSDHFTLNNVTVKNTRADGFHITGVANNGTLTNCSTINTGDDGFAVVSYASDGTTCNNISVVNPTVNVTTGGRGVSVVGGSYISYTGINVTSCFGAAIYVACEAGYTSLGSDHVTVDGGTITNANTDAATDHGAIMIYQSRTTLTNTVIDIKNLTISNTRTGATADIRIINEAGCSMSTLTLTNITITGGPTSGFSQTNATGQYVLTNVTKNGTDIGAVAATASFTATQTTGATGIRGSPATAGMSAASTLTATGTRTQFATAATTAASTLTATGVSQKPATGSMSATSSLTMTGGVTAPVVRGSAIAGASGATNASVAFTSANYDVAPVSGDLLVAFIGGNNIAWQNVGSLSGPTVTGTGWTQRGAANDTENGMWVYTRTATGNASDNVTFRVDGDASGNEADIEVVVVTVSGWATPTYGTITAASGTSYTAPSVGATGDLLLYAASSAHLTTADPISTPAGMTSVRGGDSASTAYPQYVRVAKEVLGTPGTRTGSTTAVNTGYAVGISITGTAGGSAVTITTFGTAAMSAASTTSATTFVFRPATAAMTASSTLTATGTREQPATGVMSAANTTTAAATVQALIAATASMSAASTLTAAAVREVPATASLSAASTLTATASSSGTISATAALSAASTLSASAFLVQAAAAALSASSTLSATSFATRPATGSMTAASTLTATAVVTKTATASFTAASTLTASAVVTENATEAMSAASTLTATGTKTQPATGAMSAASTLTATAFLNAAATAALTAASTLSATTFVTRPTTASFSAASTLSAFAGGLSNATAAMSASSTLTAAASRTAVVTASMTASSTLTATGVNTAVSTAALSASSTMSALVYITRPATAVFSASSTLSAAGVSTESATVAFIASSSLVVVPLASRDAAAAMTSASVLTGVAFVQQPVTASLGASSTLTAGGLVTEQGLATLVAVADLSVVIRDTIISATANLYATHTLWGEKHIQATADLQASSQLYAQAQQRLTTARGWGVRI